MKSLIAPTALIVTLITLSCVLFPSADAEQNIINKDYCERVAIFEYQGQLGYQPSERDGWPNYKGIDCSTYIGE